MPATVGGGGTHADGKVPRFREDDFQLLERAGPHRGRRRSADWPLAYDELEPYYAEAERAIGVAGAAGANPFAAWRSGPYPMPPGAPMYGATSLDRGGRARSASTPTPRRRRPTRVALRRPAGVQQLRVLRLLRLPHPRQGRPGGPAAAGLLTGMAELRPEPSCPASARAATGPPGSTSSVPTASSARWTARHVVVAGGSHRDAAPAPALGDRPPAHRPPPDVPLPDDRGRHVPRAPARPTGPGRHPRPRRPDRRRRRVPCGRRGRRPAVDHGAVWSSTAAPPCRSWRPRSTPGGPAQGADARFADARPPLGLHHAGRGPAAPDEHGRPRPDRPRRPRASRGPGHLPAAPARAGRLRAPRAALEAILKEMGAGWTTRRPAHRAPQPGRWGVTDPREPSRDGDHAHGGQTRTPRWWTRSVACTGSRTWWSPTPRCS